MKIYFGSLYLCFLLISVSLLSACVQMKQQQYGKAEVKNNIAVKLTQYPQSDFKQVEVHFFTAKSKELVFRVLSDIEKTPQWFNRVDTLEVLAVYNNQQYLLRTIINMPWPFKNRELITCVNTYFEEIITTIDIYSCSERITENKQYLRLQRVASNWTIEKVSDRLVEVNYKTWLDPEGNIPAFIFNSELVDSTKVDFKKLQSIISHASLNQFAY